MIDFAVGCALASAGVWGLLMSGLARPWAVVPVSLAAIAWSLRKVERPGWPDRIWWAASPGLALMFVHALAPEIQPDAAGYHLGLVAAWARNGAFGPLTGFYDAMPLGLETLFLPGYILAGSTGAKLIHLALFLGSLALIRRVGLQHGLTANQAVAAAVFYSYTPVVMVTGSSAYNDAGLVFFVLASYSALLERRWAAAGIAAGFCYAVKMPGALVPAAAVVWLLARREWRPAGSFALCASATASPWVARSLWHTGNPVAPLANSLFINDWFHGHSEKVLADFLTDYGGLSGFSLLRSLLWGGAQLQGLIGPACVILPLGLLALRKPLMRPLVAAGLVLLLPWASNRGARFVMPSLPFMTLAASAVLPGAVFLAATAAHGASALPAVMDKYTDPGAWRLRETPWRAALRLESAEDYLTRNLWEYRFARRVAGRVKPGETLLDLYGLPWAYLPVVPLGPPNSCKYDNLVWALTAGATGLPDELRRMECAWPRRFVREIRIEAAAGMKVPLVLGDVNPVRAGQSIPISRNWFLDAFPNGCDSPFALDNNLASRWSTHESAEAGNWWALRFDRPVPLDGVKVDFINLGDHRRDVRVSVTSIEGRREEACAGVEAAPQAPRTYRKGAAAFLRANGVRWLAGREQGDGNALVVKSLLAAPDLFGLKVVERVDDLVLFRVE